MKDILRYCFEQLIESFDCFVYCIDFFVKTTVDTTVAAEMEKAVQEAKNLHGTPKEKAIKVLCSRLGIQYENFTDEEFAHFIKVFESAKNLNLLLKGNQRGKSVGSHSKRKGRGKNKRL